MAKGHGGARKGGGRPKKSDEVALIEALSPMDDLAMAAMKSGLKNKDNATLKLFLAYRHGQPNHKYENVGDKPLFGVIALPKDE